MATRVSLAGRAILALVLLIGFYLLALVMAGVLLFLAYEMVVYGGRIPVKLLFFLVATAGIILWSILPRWDRFTAPGPRLTEESQPRLFAEIRDIAQATGQAMPREVYLEPDVNAWVAQRGGVLGIGSRRIMGLGLGLMQVLSRSQFRAVLAHEFGHYHGGDTALGPLIYRTRSAIGRTLQGLGDSFLNKPFELYGNLFLRITSAVSRREEFVADELAATVVGARPLASGLRRTRGAGLAFRSYWENEYAAALSRGHRPPFAEGFQRFLQAERIRPIVESATEEAAVSTRQADPYDSHPTLRERIEAVAHLPLGPDPDREPAAVTLLDNLPDLEHAMLGAMFSAENISQLRATTWEGLGPDMYVPTWREALIQYGKPPFANLTPRALAPLLAGSRPGGALDQFARNWAAAVGQDAPRNPQEAGSMLASIAGCALAVRLIDRGGRLDATPGDPIRITLEGKSFEPFDDVQKLADGSLTPAAWEAACESLGIADLPLVDDPAPDTSPA
jgi:Zn-dependent protease with chaperone function